MPLNWLDATSVDDELTIYRSEGSVKDLLDEGTTRTLDFQRS
jgi:hypothetical protein